MGASAEDSQIPQVNTYYLGNVQLINYTQMEAKHIPKYCRLVAFYKFKILLDTQTIDPESLESVHTLNNGHKKFDHVTKLNMQQISEDLKNRTIADLDR